MLEAIKNVADLGVCLPGSDYAKSKTGPCAVGPEPQVSQTSVNWLTSSLVIATFWYYLTTLFFELPILWLMGFKTKKALATVLVANLLSVFSFHLLAAKFNSSGGPDLSQGIHSGFIVAELLITFFEATIYVIVLSKELRISHIISAAILANASSAIIGGYVINSLLGGFH
jgi:hypothetical protein